MWVFILVYWIYYQTLWSDIYAKRPMLHSLFNQINTRTKCAFGEIHHWYADWQCSIFSSVEFAIRYFMPTYFTRRRVRMQHDEALEEWNNVALAPVSDIWRIIVTPPLSQNNYSCRQPVNNNNRCTGYHPVHIQTSLIISSIKFLPTRRYSRFCVDFS